MPTYFGLVAHASERHPNEGPLRRIGDRLAEGGLAHARRSDEAEDRALVVAGHFANREVLEDPLLYLFQAVASVSGLIARATFWLLMAFALLIAVDTLEVRALTATIDRFLEYVPQIFGAAILLLVGVVAGRRPSSSMSWSASSSALEPWTP